MNGTKREKPDWDAGLGHIEVCEVVKLTFMSQKMPVSCLRSANVLLAKGKMQLMQNAGTVLIWCRGDHSCNNNFTSFIKLWPGDTKSRRAREGEAWPIWEPVLCKYVENSSLSSSRKESIENISK
jgi:hypothetical protein